ncbi:hypothetical protein PLESTF_001371200 [Pleodorina starrii]|nr:hypothetical protein PLESTF_001371200 [Pleodorina starrii]
MCAVPPLVKAETTQPQYYMGFGNCPRKMQDQSYGNWPMYRPPAQQPGSLTLFLDTRLARHVANAAGSVKPLDFPITNLFFAFFSTAAVQKYAELMATKTTSMEAASWYRVHVNGVQQGSVMDMKNVLTPLNFAPSSNFSLKITLNRGAIAPAYDAFNITISKNCRTPSMCATIPDPAIAFGSPLGHVVFSLWSVNQMLSIDGAAPRAEAWCPVQSAINRDCRYFVIAWHQLCVLVSLPDDSDMRIHAAGGVAGAPPLIRMQQSHVYHHARYSPAVRYPKGL